MNKYLKIDNTDELVDITKRTEEDFVLTLQKEVHILPYKIFSYTTNIKVLPTFPSGVVYCIPAYAPDDTYFVKIAELAETNDIIDFEIMSATNHPITLPVGTKLGHVYVSQGLLAKDPSFYYTDENVAVKEIKKGMIKNFQYVIDEKGQHKLVLALNVRLYESNGPVAIDLKGIS